MTTRALYLALLTVLPLSACESGDTEGATLSECIDGIDNDGDGAIDCLDADCMGYGVCWEDTGIGDTDPEDSWVEDLFTFDASTLIVNEFMASNRAAVQDPASSAADPSFPDWIELLNLTDADIDLGGYTITDDLAVPAKNPLSVGLVVPAGGYLLLWVDDDEEDEGPDHLGFKLSQEGEEIGLYNPEGDPQCELRYGPQATDYSASREHDGAGTWVFDPTPTPEAANAL